VSDRFAGLWAEWQLDALCRFTPAPYDHERFRLISRGKKVPLSAYSDRLGLFRQEAFRQLRAGGASLALGHSENYSNQALALTRQLEAEFHCPVQVNLYVTPRASQGLGAHVDPHDVMILQLHGEKEWDIYPSSPPPNRPAAGTGMTLNADELPAFERVTLRRGGWLFLPKGTRHEVRNRADETSVHFTIGFHPLTWGEVLQRALNSARVATPALNETLLPEVTLPPTTVQMEARLAALLSWVNVPEQVTAYYADFPALEVQVPAAHVVPLAQLEAADAATVFRWRAEAALVGGQVGSPEIVLPYRRVPVRLKSELADRLRQMIQKQTFTPREIDERDLDSAVLLCRFLAGVGVLGVERLSSPTA